MVQVAEQFDNRRRVLEATDIVGLVGEHLSLRAKGREFVGLCPFHDDHKPSMSVVPHKQIFCCFSCGAAGNAIDFVMKYHAMDFRQALEFLASRAGIELVRPKFTAREDSAGGSSKDQLLAAAATAQSFFRGILKHPEHGSAARAIIESRGISPEMVDAFELGASPDRWDGLLKTLQSKGLDLQAFLDAGLLKSRESGGAYDGFRHRLMFPIFDQIGRAVAFGGRKIRDEDEPKYLNSPESAVFDKGGTLFALKQAFRAIQSSRTAVITEGYLDAITCHQFGFTNVVATLGTALTSKHAAILRRIADTVILLFDGDEAGQRAADRAFEVFFAEPVDVKVAILPDELDPDDLLKSEGGPERFRAVLAGAIDATAYRYQRMTAALDAAGRAPGSAARIRIVQEDLARLAELGLRDLSPIRRQAMIRQLARIAGVDETTVAASMPTSKPRANAANSQPATAGQKPGVSMSVSALDHAFGCLLLEPDLVQSFSLDAEEILKAHAYSSGPFRGVAERLLLASSTGERVETASLLAEIEREEDRQTAAALIAKIERECRDDRDDRVIDLWNDCVKRFKLEQSGLPITPAEIGGAPESAVTGAASIASLLERARQRHQQHGGNPLAHPKVSRIPSG